MNLAWQAVDVVLAAALGAVILYALVMLRHWPFRPIRKWEDELVAKEIAAATDWSEAQGADAARAYVQGLRTAAIQLGHTPPVYRQERALRRVTR